MKIGVLGVGAIGGIIGGYLARANHDVTLVDHAPVWYREGGEVRTVPRARFRALASEGSVGPTDPVFDTSLTRISQARDGSLERPASETWHGPAFFEERISA